MDTYVLSRAGGKIYCYASAMISSMNPPAKNSLFLPNHSRRRTILIIILLVMAVAIAGLVYNKSVVDKRLEQAVAADRAKFAEVEKDMAAAWKPIDSAAQPRKSCYYTSQKYSEGTLKCQVILQKQSVSMDEASDSFNALLESEQFATRFIVVKNDALSTTVAERRVLDLNHTSGVGCLLMYSKTSVSGQYITSLQCITQSIKPIYPLAQ